MSTLVGWWKGEDNGNDEIYGNTAIGIGQVQYDDGYIGRCFKSITVEGETFGSWYIPYTSKYLFNPTGAFSIEFYLQVFAQTEEDNYRIFEKSGSFYLLYNSEEGTIKLFVPSTGFQKWYVPGLTLSFKKIKLTYDNSRWELYANDIKQDPYYGYDDTAYIHNTSRYYFCAIYSEGDVSGQYIKIDEIKIYDDSVVPTTKTIRFSDNSKGLVASIDFDFGDGSAHATDLPVDHEYNTEETGDTVNATLTVTDTKGNTDTITKTIDLS